MQIENIGFDRRLNPSDRPERQAGQNAVLHASENHYNLLSSSTTGMPCSKPSPRQNRRPRNKNRRAHENRVAGGYLELLEFYSVGSARKSFSARSSGRLRLISPNAKATRLAAVRPNAGLAALYERRLKSLLDEMNSSPIYWISAAYKANEPAMAADASPADILQRAFARLARRWQRRLFGFHINEIQAQLAS